MRSSDVFLVPFFASALVLAGAGASKLRSPGQLVRALASAGVPAGPWTARVVALGDLALSAVVLARPTTPAAVALGLVYVAFALFLSFLLVARPAASSCGCAGARELPPSWFHVGLDLAAAASAFGYAATHPAIGSIFSAAARLPLHGVSFVVGVGLLGYLSTLCAAYLPGALESYQGQH